MPLNIQADNHDFEFAQRGLLLPVEDPIILSHSTPEEVVWNTEAYAFLESDCPATANQLLWRQGQLCSTTAGLYQVIPGIYQIRGLDLSNMSIVQIPETNKIVVIDCLTSVETAKRAIELYQLYHKEAYGQEADIEALLYTHCHADHFGGAQVIVDKAGEGLKIIGPEGFLEHAVSENIYAGIAMARRSIYMYGQTLDKSPTGQIGCGLGQALPAGKGSLVAPTHSIKVDGPLAAKIPGLEIICQLTPGTEAPAEVNFFFPHYSALCAAENATHTLHNIQTLRGAPVRDARLWSRYLDETIALFGEKTQVVFASHHWPTWNQDAQNLVVTFLSEQRDYYAYLHNETLRQVNNGLTPVEISEAIQMPPTLSTRTNLQGYYGSVNHNVKAVYDKYMGWFDGNPVNLWPHQPVDEAARFIDCMGGSAAVLEKARGYYDNKDLRFAATLLNKLVFADPTNQDALNLLATVYTALGQGAENGTWRNIYLTGAQELLNAPTPIIQGLEAEALLALSLDELFDTLAIRINGPKASLESGVTIDFMIEDLQQGPKTGGGWHLRLSNGALTGRARTYVASPDGAELTATLTVWLKHKTLVGLVGSAAEGRPAGLDGLVTSGDTGAWDTVTSFVVLPNTAFNIVKP